MYSGAAGGGLGTLREVRLSGTISISDRGYVNCKVNCGVEDANNYAEFIHRKVATVTNLTRIDITADTASGIGIDSRFRLWRKM